MNPLQYYSPPPPIIHSLWGNLLNFTLPGVKNPFHPLVCPNTAPGEPKHVARRETNLHHIQRDVMRYHIFSLVAFTQQDLFPSCSGKRLKNNTKDTWDSTWHAEVRSFRVSFSNAMVPHNSKSSHTYTILIMSSHATTSPQASMQLGLSMCAQALPPTYMGQPLILLFLLPFSTCQ